MKVIRISELDEEPVATATPIPGWTGGQVSRTRQTPVNANPAKDKGPRPAGDFISRGLQGWRLRRYTW